MIKKLLNATKIKPYSPEGTLNLKCILDECALPGVNTTLWSRPHSGGFAEENQKLFHHARLSS
jgi:hypothetical protein